MIDLARLKAANAARWAAMHVEPALGATLDRVAGRLIEPAAKARYVIVAAQTSVPWFIVAVIHEREACRKAGRAIWRRAIRGTRCRCMCRKAGAVSQLGKRRGQCARRCAPYAAHWADWSVGGALTFLEEYNGLGYAQRGVASPYIWAGTDQYRSGKYIADGHFDPHAIDHQLGCAALLARMAIFDQSVTFSKGATS